MPAARQIAFFVGLCLYLCDFSIVLGGGTEREEILELNSGKLSITHTTKALMFIVINVPKATIGLVGNQT